ncbi:MAG: DUF3341 domain-containing protein [Verrucomicrobia bacterium]|nr:DUF3341 domain-containing protein [Verrucomicrobiota bacterium]
MQPQTRGHLYGIIAEFGTSESILNAASEVYRAGYRHLDAYTPFPVDDLAESIGKGKSLIAPIVFIGGITGGLTGYFLQLWGIGINYPYDIGSRPLNSWPLYIPITFELTILFAALSGFIGMFWLNRLPCIHHPVFGVPGFERASVDRFFLSIEASDPLFDAILVNEFLAGMEPIRVVEIRTR